MKGRRWTALLDAYKHLLTMLQKMPDVVVTIFSFDDAPHLLCREITPKEALEKAARLVFGGKGTNYGRALEMVEGCISKSKFPDYISCVLFFSDGASEAPTTELNKLVQLKEGGKSILLITIACETDEDQDLQKMARAMEGDHYKTTSARALRQIFEKILTLS